MIRLTLSSTGVSRQRFLDSLTVFVALGAITFGQGQLVAQSPATRNRKPNVVYFLVDNLGMGELSSYSGDPFRGVTTSRINGFAKEGMMLLNFAPEAQCTPSRSALMTGCYSATIIHYARLHKLLTQGSSIHVRIFEDRNEAAWWLGVAVEKLVPETAFPQPRGSMKLVRRQSPENY